MYRNILLVCLSLGLSPWVYALDGKPVWQIYTTTNSGLPHERISVIQPDGDGGLWLGTGAAFVSNRTGGLAHWEADGNWQVFNASNSPLPTNDVTDMAPDGKGGWWISTQGYPAGGGLVRRRADGSWQFYGTENYGFSSGVYDLLADGSGGAWVGGYRMLMRYQANGTVSTSKVMLTHASEVLLADGAGGFWLGTLADGLIRRHANGTVAYFRPFGITRIHALARDADATLWVGTGKGLLYLQAGQWHRADSAITGLPAGEAVKALAADSEGNVWVGTDSGLFLRDNDGIWQQFTQANAGLPNDNITAIYPESAASIWFGTWNADSGGGLVHLTVVPDQPLPGEDAVLIPNRAIYRNGDLLSVTIPAVPAGQDQYVGISLPDGQLFTLPNLNSLRPYAEGLFPWDGGKTALQAPIEAWIPRGYYQLYLLRLPAGMEPLANPALWQLGLSGFVVQ